MGDALTSSTYAKTGGYSLVVNNSWNIVEGHLCWRARAVRMAGVFVYYAVNVQKDREHSAREVYKEGEDGGVGRVAFA